MPRPLPALMAALMACLALAACAPRAAKTAFRSDSPIYSNAVLDLRGLSGRWVQVAAFGHDPATACRAGGARFFLDRTGALATIARLCLDGNALDLNTTLALTGPGRVTPLRKTPEPLNRDWWLLWADADLRTLVFGTPDGSFGFILNRDGALPPDRLVAAKRILDFNGYDTTRLVVW